MSCNDPRDHVAEQDRAEERVDDRQGDFGVEGLAR